MKIKIIEAVTKSDSLANWGKFLIGRFDDEWEYKSLVSGSPLLSAIGWSRENLLILDLQTGEGSLFRPGGCPSADLHKHRVWVCPLFEPFLNWFYKQDLSDLDQLPALVELDAEFALYGYRRPGPEETGETSP